MLNCENVTKLSSILLHTGLITVFSSIYPCYNRARVKVFARYTEVRAHQTQRNRNLLSISKQLNKQVNQKKE